MYKLSCVKFLIALGAVCPAVLHAQEQTTYTDLYYNKDLNTTGWSADRYMQNPAAWNVGSPDGEVFDGVVNSPNNNLYINSDAITKDECLVFGYDANTWNIHNYTANITIVNSRYSVLLVAEEHKLNVGGDMNITVNSQGKWWSPDVRIYMEGGTTTSIAIEGDFRLVNSTPSPSEDAPGFGATGLKFFIGNTNALGGSFEVKGNVLLEDLYASPDWKTNDLITFATFSPVFKVGGYVDMTENRSGTRIWDMLTNTNMEYAVSDISIGGLKGSGALQTMYGLNGMVNLKFTNSEAFTYTGTYASRVDSDNTFNVIMDAADAQNGRQSLYIKEGGHAEYDGGVVAEAAAISSVTVKNGTLDFATYDGMVNGNLTISGTGGRLEISSLTAGDTGKLAFETATFDRGTIEFTITKLSADKIEISGALTKSGLGEINVEFDADTYDIREWILASGGDSIEYELITFGSTNMKESDFIAEDLGDGIFANLFIRDNALVAEFTTVPEPAHIAAVLAAAALALAAARRRKR